MYRVLLVMLLVLFVKTLPAQELVTNGASPDLYLTHKVAPRETWFAIARNYNLSPTQIAAYNKLRIDKPIEIGTTLRIPLTPANFSQNNTKAADEKLVPVYHIVQEKEWMYRISVNHNKIPIEQLEKWNSISRDEAKAGMKLIVGHLKVKEGAANSSATNTPVRETPVQQNTSAPQVRNNTPPPAPVNTGGTAAAGNAGAAANGGFFKSQFVSQGKNQSGVAGVFKSTSGWSDGKFYALMNNVTVGTIVRITLPQTNKIIFAKILGELPDMKESAGLSLRISDAAAKELGAVNNKFSVDVAY